MDEVALDEPFDKTATRGTVQKAREAVGTGAGAVVGAEVRVRVGVRIGVGVRVEDRVGESPSNSKPER